MPAKTSKRTKTPAVSKRSPKAVSKPATKKSKKPKAAKSPERSDKIEKKRSTSKRTTKAEPLKATEETTRVSPDSSTGISWEVLSALKKELDRPEWTMASLQKVLTALKKKYAPTPVKAPPVRYAVLANGKTMLIPPGATIEIKKIADNV